MSRQTGATLVEVLVAIALAGILLPVMTEAMLTSQSARPAAERRLKAAGLAREAMEATRVAREAAWSNVATAGTYHPVISGTTWALSASAENIDGFTRQIDISDVMRGTSGDIVTSGGTNDPSTKHVTVTVSWTTPYASSLTNETYLTRWQQSSTWTQTTLADFAAGTLTNTVTVASGDGAVELAPLATSGTYESTTFDAGSAVSFNSLDFTATQPAGTTLQFQLATSSSASPASWNFVGPDGTNSTFYTSAGAIPLANTNFQYLRFKAYFTGPGTATPTLSDVTVGYSK